MVSTNIRLAIITIIVLYVITHIYLLLYLIFPWLRECTTESGFDFLVNILEKSYVFIAGGLMTSKVGDYLKKYLNE